MFSTIFLIETALFLVIAIPMSVMDIKKFRISLPFTFAGIAFFILWHIFKCWNGSSGLNVQRLLFSGKILLISVLTSTLVLFIVRVLSGNGLGIGDIIFGIFTALYCRFFHNLTALCFSALLGILYYLLCSIIDKFKNQQKILRPVFAIPFVPFISAGAVLARVFFG